MQCEHRPGTRVPGCRDRPLSRTITWTSSGPSTSPGRRGPVMIDEVGRQRAGRWRCGPASAAAGRARGSAATIRSMPMIATCTLGRDVHRRPLPSLVTSTSEPVSATAKFTPEIPMSAAQELAPQPLPGEGAQLVAVVGQRAAPAGSVNSRATSSRGLVHRRGDDVRRRLVGQLDDVLAEVGLDHLDARPPPARALRPISSVAIDLDFATSAAAVLGDQRRGRTSAASAAVAGEEHLGRPCASARSANRSR